MYMRAGKITITKEGHLRETTLTKTHKLIVYYYYFNLLACFKMSETLEFQIS